MRTVRAIPPLILYPSDPPANTDSRTYDPPWDGERHGADRLPAIRPSGGDPACSGTPPRRAPDPAALHAPQRNAEPEVRAAPPAPRLDEALARPAAEARRRRLHRSQVHLRGRIAGHPRARPVVLDRARLQDPLPRGDGLDRRQDGARTGVHDQLIPACLDRP